MPEFKNPPKHEFRGAWIASVANIDWPKHYSDSPEKQKKDLIHLLNTLKKTGLNAVFLQVRPECDALYKSNYEPWSFWLTGEQGKPPVPYYDPLAFAIEEAHKRGLELHAWFNPYRAERIIGLYPLAKQHVVITHPEWILSFDETARKLRILNPGIPAVRQYVTKVILDVVKRYDVDGIHFDDYFYPYPNNEISKTNKDSLTFKTYKHGDASDQTIGDWRRENINILIRMVHDSIQAVKPWVKFGVSPFGIYRDSMPPGIKGMDAYDKIYCDPLQWLRDGAVDYLTPQLYWRIGGPQDFKKLFNWWANQVAKEKRHLYVGHIFGRRFTEKELPKQLELVRDNVKAQGDVYFSAKHFGFNTLKFAQKLKSVYYRYPALTPSMNKERKSLREVPLHLSFDQINAQSPACFHWAVKNGQKADSSIRFVLYRFLQRPVENVPPKESAYIYNIIGGNSFRPKPLAESVAQVYFALTSVNRNSEESRLSNVIKIVPPKVPCLVSPHDGQKFIADSVTIRWKLRPQISSYHLQIATDSMFAHLITDSAGIYENTMCTTALKGQTRYYWRVAGENPAGKSSFSKAFSFVTGFPGQTILAYPEDNTLAAALPVQLSWFTNKSADWYRVQVGEFNLFEESKTFLDTVVTDTLMVLSQIPVAESGWIYWRVKSGNVLGESRWSETFRFRQDQETLMDKATYMPDKARSE